MKRPLALICFSALILTGTSKTQSNPEPVAEPQFYSSFYALAPNGKLTELDRQKVTTFHAKTKPLPGYASVKVSAEFKPARAQTRLASDVQLSKDGLLSTHQRCTNYAP